MVVGSMIGTGIYVLPASLAAFGSISLLAWAYTATGAVLLALTFAKLNRRFSETGGPYVFCKEAYGAVGGFVSAYTYWLSNMVSIAGITVSAVGYLGFLTPLLDANSLQYHHLFALGIEITIIWLFALVNIIGIHTAGVVQLTLTIIKIIPLLFVITLGFGHIDLANYTPFVATDQSPLLSLSRAAALTFWAFIGLESATVPAENTNGTKDVYRATVYGTLITSVIYILSTVVLMGMIPMASLKASQFPFATASTLIFGAKAALIIAVCATLSGLGSINVCTLIQGQIVFAAARDRLFPHRFAKLSKENSPVAGQVFSTGLVTLFLILTMQPTLLKQFDNIANLAALLTLMTYFASSMAEIKFRYLELPTRHWFKDKSFLITLLASLYALWMMASFSLPIILTGLGLLALCVPIYYLAVRSRAQ